MVDIDSLLAYMIRLLSTGQLNNSITAVEPTTTAASIVTTTTSNTSQTLTDLPEDILLHILSLLPIETAIQTSLISQKWRNLWTKIPFVYFPARCSRKFIGNIFHNLFLNCLFLYTQVLVSRDMLCGSKYLFYNLKHLELQAAYLNSDLIGIAALLDLAPNLETLILTFIPTFNKDHITLGSDKRKPKNVFDKSNHLSLSSLRRVEIREFNAQWEDTFLVSLLSLFMSHGVVLEKIILGPSAAEDSIVSPMVIHDRPLDQEKLPNDDQEGCLEFTVEGGDEFISAYFKNESPIL